MIPYEYICMCVYISVHMCKNNHPLYHLIPQVFFFHPIHLFFCLSICLLITQVAVSPDHVVVVTTEHQVYSWGHGVKGQLGHGDTQGRSNPCLVEALKGKSVTM